MSPVCKLADHVANLFDYRGLNAFGRFIEDQQLRTARQGATYRQLLLLSAREIASASMLHLF